MPLLTASDENAKFAKSEVKIFGLSLAPHKMGGGQSVCSHSTVGCRTTCIVFSGLSRVFPRILIARIDKTQQFFADKSLFVDKLNREIASVLRNHSEKVAFRLNVYSDLSWEEMPQSPILRFPQTQFYDYTKIPERYSAFLSGRWPENYHLTFSRSEKNESDCLAFLRNGGTVSMVHAPVSKYGKYLGFPVATGDETDYRPADNLPGHWLALRTKGSQEIQQRALDTGFALP